ncbi:MAG: hypothetical protein E2577_16545, partial [Starkeya sp.]|nr:hypothetical protein [Starkeya sp.]
ATGAHQGLLEFGVAADEGVVQLRRQLRERRRKKGKRKDNAGVIATQNAAIAEYLKGWLERQKPA